MLFDLKSSRQDSDSELTVPRPPRPTANLACSHCLSSRVAPRILMRASLTRESKLWGRFGWSVVWVVHDDKLTKTSERGVGIRHSEHSWQSVQKQENMDYNHIQGTLRLD